MKEIIFVIIAIAAIGYAWSSPGIWSAPQVHISNMTQECVRVINYNLDDEYTCKNLPELYSLVWVK
jgi:hypothetical protein